ncbi:MAG: CHC2 zinc finger domain-containing protein [Candidatus Gottesmanbacteria bacterium]|nr:CHC2 zinc finger domain-containing protein [Candidatus Gottesmanbacteria bacterium]
MGRIDGLRGIELGEELKKAKIKAQLVYWCNLYLNCVNEPTPANFLSHDQIERAREYSTWELYDGHLIRSGCNFKAKCPFHEERTPSFYFYSDGSYHCFGCSAHGHSAIDYVMKLDKVDFPSAVRRLL